MAAPAPPTPSPIEIRRDRAIAKARQVRPQCFPVNPGQYVVLGSNDNYRVALTADGYVCNCPASGPCYHGEAARLYAEADASRPALRLVPRDASTARPFYCIECGQSPALGTGTLCARCTNDHTIAAQRARLAEFDAEAAYAMPGEYYR